MTGNDKPNIIWIFGDQHRAQALGCNGNSIVRTPNIDQLALDGVNFTQAVCGYPLCCPMRGTLLTSQYPHNAVPGHEYQLDPEIPTIADVLNGEGYNTAYFGKWHVDGAHERFCDAAKHLVPQAHRGGFRTWIGYENNNKPWECWVHGHDEKGQEIAHYMLDDYETDELTSLMLNYIEDHSNNQEPFFSVLSIQPPHSPYFGPEETMENYYQDEFFINPVDFPLRPNVPADQETQQAARKDLASYYSMIEQIDVNVGRIIQKLKEKGIYENTCIIFFSDHGDMHYSHGHRAKTTAYEESIRVPFILGGGYIKQNLQGKKGKCTNAILNHVDIATTTLGIAKVTKPMEMLGFDYSPYMQHDCETIAEEPTSAYIQSNIPTGHGDCIDKPWRGVITKEGWKYVCFEGCDWLMFDLKKDPYELTNMAHYTKYHEKKQILQEMLRDWIQNTNDSFLVPSLTSSNEQMKANEIDSILKALKGTSLEELIDQAKKKQIQISEKDLKMMQKLQQN